MNKSMVNADLNTSVSGYQVNLVSCCNINKITVVLFYILFLAERFSCPLLFGVSVCVPVCDCVKMEKSHSKVLVI